MMLQLWILVVMLWVILKCVAMLEILLKMDVDFRIASSQSPEQCVSIENSNQSLVLQSLAAFEEQVEGISIKRIDDFRLIVSVSKCLIPFVATLSTESDIKFVGLLDGLIVAYFCLVSI